MTPNFSSFLIRDCSISGRMSFLMLLFLFTVALCFFSGAGSGFLSEKLLESVKKIIIIKQPFLEN